MIQPARSRERRRRTWSQHKFFALVLGLLALPFPAEADDASPQVSDAEVQAVQTYLQTPGYADRFRSRASSTISFVEREGAEPWSEKVQLAIISGLAGAKRCGTSLASPERPPDLIFRVIGNSKWTREDIDDQLDLPRNANIPGIADRMFERLDQNGIVSLSDDATTEGARKDHLLYTLRETRAEDYRTFALYRAAFGLPVGPDAFGTGLFSYFMGGGSIDALVGPEGEVEERVCRAMNLQNIFCGQIDGEVSFERVRTALQSALERCHSQY